MAYLMIAMFFAFAPSIFALIYFIIGFISFFSGNDYTKKRTHTGYNENFTKKTTIEAKEENFTVETTVKRPTIYEIKAREYEMEEIEYKNMISSICSDLEKMELYEKKYWDELAAQYALFKKRPADVNDINKILHEKQKEVTYLNGYYILCEIGFHEQRMKDIQAIRHNNHLL